jgi:hypothetical protein
VIDIRQHAEDADDASAGGTGCASPRPN